MDAYDRCTNLKKNLADNAAIYGRGRELLRRDADHSPPSTGEVTNE
jgi:hypothetical protein